MQQSMAMITQSMPLSRRFILAGAGATAGSAMLPSFALAAQAQGKIVIPPPISREERLSRVAKAQMFMRDAGFGSLLIESGPSLDYFTGVQWWRSERLTAAVIPATGDPIIVTPFFEKPSVEESLKIPAEVRVWQEHEDPLKVVADFLRERGVDGRQIGSEETNRYFIIDRLQWQLPGTRILNANDVIRPLRMSKSPAELALMQAASDITIAAFRRIYPQIREGMTPDDIEKLFNQAIASLGGSSPWALILFGEASAYPHGSGKPQHVRRGEIVLLDCGCSVHGYQSDISRTFVFGAKPTVEQRKVWNQVRRGQDIAFAAAKIGATAGSVDDAVRAAYESWGYGPGYKLPGLSHRTGHGIGMEGHEPVNLVHGERTRLRPGMCFSNEPGIYIPGKFGVRLEDCFYMTDAGPRFFSQPPPSIDRPFG